MGSIGDPDKRRDEFNEGRIMALGLLIPQDCAYVNKNRTVSTSIGA